MHIYASKQEGLDRAKAMIDRMFQEIEVGKVYTGKVVSVTQFGAFKEVLPGKDGLVHVSEPPLPFIKPASPQGPPVFRFYSKWLGHPCSRPLQEASGLLNLST